MTDPLKSWEHPQYSRTRCAVSKMRDCVSGEDKIKQEGKKYLPHPCLDPEEAAKPEQVERYGAYKLFAEYENITGGTLDTLIGSMFRVAPVIEVDKVDPMLDMDSDGNGSSLSQSIELTASECLQMRYHGLLVEYSDLAGVDPIEITVQDQQDNNLRATIKHYTRESIVNWSYRVINGSKKLNMVILAEVESQAFDPMSVNVSGLNQDIIAAYLVLGLDDNNEYFQRRFVISGKAGEGAQESGFVYPEAGGKRLNEIPFEIVFSSERQTGDIPEQMGYLYPVATKTIHRYQVSALLKEALRLTAQPTSYTKGWDNNSFEQYKEATGRDHIALGSGQHIPLFGNAEAGYIVWEADSNALFKYMENNKNEIIAVGGVYNEDGENSETATAAAINSAEKKGTLSTLAKNIEESYRRVLNWAAMFNGTSAEDSMLVLSREFVSITLSAQDRAAILAELNSGVITRHEALRQLERGGVTTKKAEDLLEEIERNGEM